MTCCVGGTITCSYPRVARAAAFEVSIEWGEEDSHADTAQALQYGGRSVNKVSSEDRRDLQPQTVISNCVSCIN